MKIAIIGSGNVGKALAGSAAKAGHTVTITANDPRPSTVRRPPKGSRSRRPRYTS